MALADRVRSTVAGFPGNFAVYARNLGTGEVVDVDADDVMPTENAAKTFLLITYCQLVARRELDSDTRVRLPEDFGLHGPGVLRYRRPGLEPTLTSLGS